MIDARAMRELADIVEEIARTEAEISGPESSLATTRDKLWTLRAKADDLAAKAGVQLDLGGGEIVSQAAYARALGIHPTSINRMIKIGKIGPEAITENRKIIVARADSMLIATMPSDSKIVARIRAQQAEEKEGETGQ